MSDHQDDPPNPPGASGARPAALLVVRVTPGDVGRRVSLRRRLDASTLTDVVGRLLSWEDGMLVVERRDGTTASVRAADLVAGKVVPEPPTAPTHRRG